MGRPDTMGEAVGGARSGAPGNTRSGACAGGGTPRGMCRETLVKIFTCENQTKVFTEDQKYNLCTLALQTVLTPVRRTCTYPVSKLLTVYNS